MQRHATGSKSPSEIFVLEDDRGIREVLSMLLKKAGYDVVCFADSKALLAAARTRIPACILLDMFVPGRSGLELLEELRGDKYPAPVIMISGHGDVAMAVSAMNANKVSRIVVVRPPVEAGEKLGFLP